MSTVNLDDLQLNGTENTLSEIIMNERNKNIYKAILYLSESYKEVVILYYFCNFSLKEIAKTMNISNGAVRTLLYRSRKKLKDLLKEEKDEL